MPPYSLLPLPHVSGAEPSRNMTLHPPVDRSSNYSSLNRSDSELSSNDEPTGSRLVPILKNHISKWDAKMSCKDEHRIEFDTLGMPKGYGVKHGDLVSYSLSIINTIIAGGSTRVTFPIASQKIRLRIEVSLENFQTTRGRSPDAFCYSGPVMAELIFTAPST